jgi:predicted acyltransferase
MPSTERLLSVDALRGFDMLWIIGDDGVAGAIIKFFSPSVQGALLPQLRHCQWEGFVFHDLIFPIFLLLVGMSAVFSLSKTLAREGKGAAYRRILWRSLALFLWGFLFYGGFSHRWPDIRLMGVLQRIALCYLFTGIAFIELRPRGIAIAGIALLLSNWALFSFVPVPGQETISFAQGDQTWASYVDARFLPGEKSEGEWDCLGLLSTLPTIPICLLGILAAQLLRNPNLSERLKFASLIGGGILCVAFGYAWGVHYPIIKKICTSSFVLVASGYSCILLGLFYGLIDVWKLRRWTTPLLWIGSNAITLYLVQNVVNVYELTCRLVGGDIRAAVGEPTGALLVALVSLGLMLVLARFLYQRRIFLRV